MKKQLLLALMLFAFIFPCEIAEAKDILLNSLQEQPTTGQLLLGGDHDGKINDGVWDD